MKHSLSRNLYSCWNRSRGDCPAPSRAGFDPAELGPQLVHCLLIDLSAAGPAAIRFCGSSLAMRYGRDLTGEDFISLWAAQDRRAVTTALFHMRRGATGIVASVGAETAGGGCTIFELLLLPLRGGAECDRAIGSMVRVGGHQETNRIKARIVAQSLGSYRCLIGEPASAAPSEIAAGGTVLPPQRPRKTHLVVIAGGAREERPLTRS